MRKRLDPRHPHFHLLHLKIPRTAENRAKVLRALASDIDKIRNQAAMTLSVWSDTEAVEALRTLLVRGLRAERFAWLDRETAIKALLPCIKNAHATWLLDLYFSHSAEPASRDLLPLLRRLSNAVQRDRLVAESASEDPARRRAALVACASIHLDEEPAIVERLSRDPHGEVAELASRYLEQVHRREPRKRSDPLLQKLVTKFRPMLERVPAKTTHAARHRHFLVQEYTKEDGELLQCWRLTSRAIHRVPPSSWRKIGRWPESGVRASGMIRFWLSEEGEELCVDCTDLSRFQRGRTYRVHRDGQRVSLEDEVLWWPRHRGTITI